MKKIFPIFLYAGLLFFAIPHITFADGTITSVCFNPNNNTLTMSWIVGISNINSGDLEDLQMIDQTQAGADEYAINTVNNAGDISQCTYITNNAINCTNLPLTAYPDEPSYNANDSYVFYDEYGYSNINYIEYVDYGGTGYAGDVPLCASPTPTPTPTNTPTPTPTATPPSVVTITVTPSPVKEKTVITAAASFTYPSKSSTNIAKWNWGDGTASTGTLTETNGSGSVKNTHIYTSLGSFTIKLTVTNSEGLSGTATVIEAVIPIGGLERANLTRLNYSAANLSSQNMSSSNLTAAVFNNTNFMDANLSGDNGTDASFQQANFTGATLISAKMTKSNFTNADLTNANLTGADLDGSNFTNAKVTGVIWSNTECPDGTNSNKDDKTCVSNGG